MLRSHPAVEDACVVGVPDAEWGQRVAAMVALRAGETVSEADLIAYSRERLAGYKQPRTVVFADELPQTASGKVQRAGTRAVRMRKNDAKTQRVKEDTIYLCAFALCAFALGFIAMLINGIEYHVEARGAGEPLVLLHGFTGSGANWAAQVEAFATDFRVVTIDLLGHGQTESPSDPTRYAIEPAAADLIAIFDALELERVNLLGYSMGGRLALYTALSYPRAHRPLDPRKRLARFAAAR